MNRFVISLIIFAFSVSNVFATGDWAQAPQGLDHYMGRLPGKSLAQLVREKAGKAERIEGPIDTDGVQWRLKWLLKSIGKSSRTDSIEECDDFLAVLRQSPLIPPAWANLVIDIRDCLRDKKTPDAEAFEYCQWRYQLGTISGKLSAPKRAELKQRLNAGKGRTMAHYRYLAGADEYFTDDEKSDHGQQHFATVAQAYPKHPRAETALFMIGRSALKNSRGGWGEDPSAEELDIADSVFKSYLKSYPRGRFVGDVQGWLGAVAVKREKFAEALSWYFRQMEVKGHPENVRSATQMVERVLAVLLAKPDEQSLKEIAARPEVAMATVYWVLHAPEADIHNGFYDHPEVVARWRTHWLPRLAKAVQQQRAIWNDHEAMPWFIAIQAHAASNAGDQKGALEIVRAQPALLESSDDLAFMRAVILQRSNAAEQAITAYREFLNDFPSSALARGATFRLATAYQDAGKSDDAVAVLLQLIVNEEPDEDEWPEPTGYYQMDFYPASYASLPPAASALSPDMSVAEEGQIRQYLDTLLQFGPLDELVRLERLKAAIRPAHWGKIRVTLLGRALSEGQQDFAAALTSRKDSGLASQLAAMVKSVSEKPSAKTYLELGNAWQAARGKLTSSALLTDREEIYVEANSTAPEELRMANAELIGFAEGAQDRILRMDELWNAVRAWEKAAELADPGSAEQAKALSAILEALPRIAMATPFARRFAAEKGWNEWAEKLYQQLIADCPESPEARVAARPSFRTGVERKEANLDQNEAVKVDPAKADPFEQVHPAWKESLYGFRQKYKRHREFLYGSLLEPENADWSSKRTHPDYQNLVDLLYAVDGTAPLVKLVLQMEGLRKQSQKLYRNWNDACIHYAIEDLADLVLRDKGMNPVVRARYFDIRRHAINVMVWNYAIKLQKIPGAKDRNISDVVIEEVDQALVDPLMKGIADRLECLRLFLVANRGISLPVKNRLKADYPGEKTIETRDYEAVEKAARRFLDKYPDSSKREAVWLLYLRSSYRARRPLLYSSAAAFPENPFLTAQLIRKVQGNQLPWDAQPVETAIKAYLSEYQKPKYTGEVLDLQTALAVRRGDWEGALSNTLRILGNPRYKDLHSDSRLRLSNIFARLAEPSDRVAVLKAIKSNEKASEYLRRYIDATDKNGWGMDPLYFLTAWLREEVEG